MKFVMTQAVTSEGLKMLDGVSDIYVANNQDPNNYLEEMQDADALIVRIAKCDGNVIENIPNLKVIGRTGVGYDTVDVKTATKHGIPVVITPGANNRSVAEHTVAMMFALSKNLIEAQNEMITGNWEIRGAKKAFELENKTVGILGLGAIGKETVKICKGCGMKVAGYDPFLSQKDIEAMGVEFFENYEDLLKVSDVVSIHVPLTDSTENMISSKQLLMMKKSAIIINCSRGGIVNEADLVEALKKGTIAGAALDVFCNEPPEPNDPLLNCPNLVISPHSAAQTREAVIKMAKMCIEGCLAIVNGKKWPFVADQTVYDHPKWEGTDWAEI
ncbi:hydroxyacid dehydrogenase [Clostridium sp. UBA6640]|uniref:hydroxyacid dehydrogenase n=1 Tax=Clostridium sp. UBA6640 TaxID=1946370 RepID=UPI0025BE2F2A|nr:hydroxyacid dehydrogenase [Clostridium sp. UBA6640]